MRGASVCLPPGQRLRVAAVARRARQLVAGGPGGGAVMWERTARPRLSGARLFSLIGF